jgi:hypothetical protein
VSSLIKSVQQRNIQLGTKLDKAAAALPQTGDLTLFTVTGGRIILTGLVAQVTTVIQNQACTVQFKSVPTVGSTVTISGTASIIAAEVGALFSLDGTALSTAPSGVPAGAGAALFTRGGGIIIPVGSIKMATSASNTGAMSYTMTFISLDDGAQVAAA